MTHSANRTDVSRAYHNGSQSWIKHHVAKHKSFSLNLLLFIPIAACPVSVISLVAPPHLLYPLCDHRDLVKPALKIVGTEKKNSCFCF